MYENRIGTNYTIRFIELLCNISLEIINILLTIVK